MGARSVRRGHPVVARLCLDTFPGARRWQNAREMRSPGVRRWRDCALMRPWPDWQWQDSAAVRSRAAIRGKFCAPCIRNELALAGSARHASEMPRKPPLEDTPREYPARKGHFSLHGPLESCTARESCHPASTKHPSARNPCADDQRQTARAPATPAPPNSTEQHEPPATTPPPSWQRATHSIRGASGSHTANAPTPHRPATLRRQADVKSCAARAPQRQSATRGNRAVNAPAPRINARSAKPLATPHANQQQSSAGLLFVPSKARTHHTYLSAAPVAGFSS